MKKTSTSCFILSLFFAVQTAFAGPALAFVPTDTVKTVLERQTGQQVELKLKSGEKIAGKVAEVGEKTIHLSAITGQEFFEAVVLIDDVSVVMVRAAAK